MKFRPSQERLAVTYCMLKCERARRLPRQLRVHRGQRLRQPRRRRDPGPRQSAILQHSCVDARGQRERAERAGQEHERRERRLGALSARLVPVRGQSAARPALRRCRALRARALKRLQTHARAAAALHARLSRFQKQTQRAARSTAASPAMPRAQPRRRCVYDHVYPSSIHDTSLDSSHAARLGCVALLGARGASADTWGSGLGARPYCNPHIESVETQLEAANRSSSAVVCARLDLDCIRPGAESERDAASDPSPASRRRLRPKRRQRRRPKRRRLKPPCTERSASSRSRGRAEAEAEAEAETPPRDGR